MDFGVNFKNTNVSDNLMENLLTAFDRRESTFIFFACSRKACS